MEVGPGRSESVKGGNREKGRVGVKNRDKRARFVRILFGVSFTASSDKRAFSRFVTAMAVIGATFGGKIVPLNLSGNNSVTYDVTIFPPNVEKM